MKEMVSSSGPAITLHSMMSDAPPRACVMLGLAEGKLHVRSSQWIEPSSRIRAQFEHHSFTGEVEYCTRKDSWFRVCIDLMAEDDQRRKPRLALRQKGAVTTLSNAGPSSSPGMLLDLAIAGMRIEVPHRVEAGTMIYIETETALIAGEVRHCGEGSEGNFEAGVAVTDILPAIQLKGPAPGVVKNILRKLGQAISGEKQ
ncbi:MAG TPA: hypothetical protein VHC90_18310 [Bryobacteraceae bacterium]|nr:hypothetical protein [Bryobacteraceae bacterium]